MPPPICRLVPYAVADGPHNMATDEALLELASFGQASLRFYGWSEATASLGYFQAEVLRREDSCLAGLPYVRRPSGGATLVHHHEVTYALALPAGAPWQTGESWLCRMHGFVAAALAGLGVTARLCSPTPEPPFAGVLCFQHFTPGDVLIGTAKVGGSAQRRQRGALMQHGGILLAASPHAPVLPGIRELSGQSLSDEEISTASVREFARQTGWDVVPGAWRAAQRRRIESLTVDKYASDAWNKKR